MKKIEGKLTGNGLKVCIVASRFNDFIVGRLIEGCIDFLVRHDVVEDDITLVRVPGSYEIPQTAQVCARSDRYDAVICLGAVIRGDTPHFDYVAAEAAKGVAQVGLAAEKPVIFGILTTDTIEQAIERAGTKSGNKGAAAAADAVEMVNLLRQIS